MTYIVTKQRKQPKWLVAFSLAVSAAYTVVLMADVIWRMKYTEKTEVEE